jgi:hypothetical protein
VADCLDWPGRKQHAKIAGFIGLVTEQDDGDNIVTMKANVAY